MTAPRLCGPLPRSGSVWVLPSCHSRASALSGARGIPESGTLRAAATREGDTTETQADPLPPPPLFDTGEGSGAASSPMMLRGRQTPGRPILPALFAVLIATSWSCALAPEGASSAAHRSEPSPSSDPRYERMAGVWQGRSVCELNPHYGMSCLGFRNISFTFVQTNGSGKAGFYRCRTGTAECRNRLGRGTIARIDMLGTRVWLRVMLGDGSSCLFSSRPRPRQMVGGYECTSGAAMVEEGWWRADRIY